LNTLVLGIALMDTLGGRPMCECYYQHITYVFAEDLR